jgi:acyl carrier protein
MNNDVVERQVRRIFADVLSIPVDQLPPEVSPDAVANWDSLNHLNMVLALEQEFGIQFSPEETTKGMDALDQIVILVKDKVTAKQPAS